MTSGISDGTTKIFRLLAFLNKLDFIWIDMSDKMQNLVFCTKMAFIILIIIG